MEACNVVEREVDKVLTKFGIISGHADTVLNDLINHIELLKKELEEGVFFSSKSICSSTLRTGHFSILHSQHRFVFYPITLFYLVSL